MRMNPHARLSLVTLITVSVIHSAMCQDLAQSREDRDPAASLKAEVAELLDKLRHADRTPRTDVLMQLSELGPNAKPAIPQLRQLISKFDASSDDHFVASCLTAIRRIGVDAESLRGDLLPLISERASLYNGRDKKQVIRLRAYVLLTLTDIGCARSVLPYIVDYLRNADDFGLAYEAAAAARAAGSLGKDGKALIADLLALFYRDFNEMEISLERYEPNFPPSESTSTQIEIIRAFGKIGCIRDPRVKALLTLCAVGEHPKTRDDARVQSIAKHALQRPPLDPVSAIELSGIGEKAGTQQLGEELRIAYIDQDGTEGTLEELIDRPTILVFFYTRCTNTQKCSATVSRLAALQNLLRKRGLLSQVRLLGVTYEPKFDDSQRLKNYGLSRNITFDESTRFLQLDPKRHEDFISVLEVPVSYSEGWVNVHGIILFLIDQKQRVVRRYETVAWQNERVVAELDRILHK